MSSFISVSRFTYQNSKAVEQTQVVRMVVRGRRMRNRRLKGRSQILLPYKEELSMGKTEFTAAGGNDQPLTGDLRATMGGFRMRAVGGLLVSAACRVFSPFKLPEPVALSGQGEERYTYIRECRSSLWVRKLISKCDFAKWKGDIRSFLVFIPVPVVCLLLGLYSFQAVHGQLFCMECHFPLLVCSCLRTGRASELLTG